MVKTISKEEIAALPIAKFEGNIVIINNNDDADKAIYTLQSSKVVGFDTETRPSFRKGKSHKIALMQLATEDTCYLFRLNSMEFPERLQYLLNDPNTKKVGLSLKDDFSAIRKRAEFNPDGFIELQSFAKNYGIEETGLQRIYAILFREKISKRQRLTNWEAKELTSSQQMYAALDAWACLRIYNKLIKINKIDI